MRKIAMNEAVDRAPVRALCARAALHCTSCERTPGTATLLSILDVMDAMPHPISLGGPTYTSSFNYGGEVDVPWEWVRLMGWVSGIEEARMDMICNPVYLTNVVRCWDGDAECTVGTTVKYAGLPPSHRLEGDVSIDEPTELAADFLWNVVQHLALRDPDDVKRFLDLPLKEGQRLELLGPDEVEELLANGVHVVPDPADASDTAAMVKNATACMRALSVAIESGTQNAL